MFVHAPALRMGHHMYCNTHAVTQAAHCPIVGNNVCGTQHPQHVYLIQCTTHVATAPNTGHSHLIHCTQALASSKHTRYACGETPSFIDRKRTLCTHAINILCTCPPDGPFRRCSSTIKHGVSLVCEVHTICNAAHTMSMWHTSDTVRHLPCALLSPCSEHKQHVCFTISSHTTLFDCYSQNIDFCNQHWYKHAALTHQTHLVLHAACRLQEGFSTTSTRLVCADTGVCQNCAGRIPALVVSEGANATPPDRCVAHQS
jgi:hypothetical protein